MHFGSFGFVYGCCRGEYITNFTRHHCITLTFFRDTRRLFGSKSRHGLEFLCCFRTAKNFWMPIPFMYISRSLSDKFHTIDFLQFIFFTFHSPCWAIFLRKRKPKIFRIQKREIEENRKLLTFVKDKLHLQLILKLL